MHIRTSRRIPSYRLHKPTGQAVVTLNGRDKYLGKHGAAESRAAYDQVIADWLAAGRTSADLTAGQGGPGGELTIDGLADRFLDWARGHYVDGDGRVRSSTIGPFGAALAFARKVHGKTAAAAFGPRALRAVRSSMISAQLSRSTVNSYVGRLVSVYEWAVGMELVESPVWQALCAVRGLRRGEDRVREAPPVKPVEASRVDAVTPRLSRTLAAMVRLELLTGMRPGEVVILRSCDVEQDGDVWIYRPSRHKTEHHGHTREIYLSAEAQELLKPFLEEAVSVQRTYVFAPPAAGRRRVGDRYTTASYYRAVRRACAGLELKAWHPNQLRHTAATRFRAEHGLEVAQVLLGHSSVSTTQVYAEKNTELAKRVMSGVARKEG